MRGEGGAEEEEDERQGENLTDFGGVDNPGVRRIDRPRPTSPLAPEEIGAIGLRPEAGPSIEAERMRVPTPRNRWSTTPPTTSRGARR
eukprot:CAMPEP_0180137464 /NCGR_PEP_ID=MMETSP0986-20121125/12229_1 /TAXON_ID=697907 /ORGANISM="non described non described, Strain CCMP2293" /LENGTH=87 /DNA_ID=CAMNT_0022078933 /DNA_START=167 /DNA_END=427 /DNA_ORIENTATION=-